MLSHYTANKLEVPSGKEWCNWLAIFETIRYFVDQDLRFPARTKLVAIALSKFYGGKYGVCPSIQRLQKITGASRATVYRALDDLREERLLEWEEGNRFHSNKYELKWLQRFAAVREFRFTADYFNGEAMKETLLRLGGLDELSFAAKYLAIALSMDVRTENGVEVWPTKKELANRCGNLTTRAVHQSLNELHSKGLLDWEPGRAQKTNVYQLLWLENSL